MATENSHQVLIVVLGVILAALVCKTYKSQNASQKEPFQTKLTYRSSSDSTPASSVSGKDTTDIYSANPVPDMSVSSLTTALQNSDPYNLSQNDQNHFDFASMAGISKAADFSVQENKKTQSSEYPDPKTMLPQSSMNAQTIRDPFDAATMYDRPVFSLNKSTNRNESDPIRGDLQIAAEPKTGWFDSSLSRAQTLKRGYAGNFMDTQQVLDLQDVIYEPNKTEAQQSFLKDIQQKYGLSAVQPDLRFSNSHESLAL